MDVELQILKHLARDPHPTVGMIDEYCAEYKDLWLSIFPNSHLFLGFNHLIAAMNQFKPSYASG